MVKWACSPGFLHGAARELDREAGLRSSKLGPVEEDSHQDFQSMTACLMLIWLDITPDGYGCLKPREAPNVRIKSNFLSDD